MNGPLTTSKSSSDPGPVTRGFGPWTSPSPLLGPLEAAWRVASSRALPVSSARPNACRSLWRWDTLFVHDTVTVLSTDSGTTALGSAFGSREHINARVWESVRACDEMRSAIVSVDHAPTEMVLTRQCADVSKFKFHMRINGDILDHDLLASFDGQLPASVSASLCGDLPDHS